MQKFEVKKLVFSLHITRSTSSVTRPEVDVFFLLFIDFYLCYKYDVSEISFTWQIVQIN